VEQLLTAAEDGDVDKVKYLLLKLDVNTKGPNDWPWVS